MPPSAGRESTFKSNAKSKTHKNLLMKESQLIKERPEDEFDTDQADSDIYSSDDKSDDKNGAD